MLSPFLTPADAEMFEPTHERIATRAREIWRDSGCPEGLDEEIWLEAEAELEAIRRGEYRHPRRFHAW